VGPPQVPLDLVERAGELRADPVSEPVVVALIAQFGALVAIYVQSTVAKREAKQANAAVNHQGPKQPPLVEKVDRIGSSLIDLHTKVDCVDSKVDRHLAWHQALNET
jgi:outer membrane murein-binding lipoprotein Lpp